MTRITFRVRGDTILKQNPILKNFRRFTSRTLAPTAEAVSGVRRKNSEASLRLSVAAQRNGSLMGHPLFVSDPFLSADAFVECLFILKNFRRHETQFSTRRSFFVRRATKEEL
jgi:hypothetical protein